ncbi:MAG: radical SAM protein [Melioribacteraceae bacterium]|nr:radical SAM protein [Melioribacteraceae bacterium]MCF8263980.1 radical SAM protein [Melioribacteraceae bacterium]MCF8430737.1 radical SAM protein [Melioribacteraceae bacterium]
MNELRKTRSVCPVCHAPISAKIYENDDKIYMNKSCNEHGEFTDLYYGDAELYKRLMKDFYSGNGISNPITKFEGKCTTDCGICDNHKSSPIIGIIDVTNQCNLSCPVCFAQCHANKAKYEPTMDEISKMMDNLRNVDPPCPVVLFSGGEPTIREDFFEICNLAHEKGFSHIIVATNGKRIAEEPDYHEKLGKAHVDIIYLQFDGVTESPYMKLRGENLLPLKKKALENIHKSTTYPTVVLVPTIGKGINDHEIGEIVRFAAENIKSVRGILFQPIALMGKLDLDELMKRRITSGDGINILAKEFSGDITKDDFVATVTINSFLNHLKRNHNYKNVVECSVHPVCFTMSYMIKKGEHLIPLNQLIDLKGLADLMNSLNSKSSSFNSMKLLFGLPKLLKRKSFSLSGMMFKLLKNVVLKGSVDAALRFHEENVLLVGFDHTSDLNNYDCEKIERCFINYSAPNGKIIPFCSYNLFHRDEIENEFAQRIR